MTGKRTNSYSINEAGLWNKTILFNYIIGKKWVLEMNMKTQNQVVFYTIKGSTIKKFLILDCITGTGIYYAFKIISSSVLGSIVCTEGIKRLPNKQVR
ncbi:hypothetical protein [Peribacillus asahii]|uniref:hypothetical protein n=1 Tax=Peribacillus asahii TaxID=228899 RepID=UPI00380F4150